MRPAQAFGNVATTAPTEATLVIFAGQSNSIGWSQDPQITTVTTPGRAYDYRDAGATGAWLPIGRTMVGRVQGGPQSAFTEAWTAGAGGVALCVSVAVNGATMIDASKTAQSGNAATLGYESLGGGTWDLTVGANSLYTQANGAKVQIDKAIASAAANGFVIRKRVVVWVQGETDAGANASTANYTPRLVALIDRFVVDYAIDGFLIAALGVASASPTAAWANIRQGQVDAAAARPTVATMAFTDTPNFFAAGKNVAGDSLHYTQQGYNEMGAGLAANGLTFTGISGMAAPAPSVYGGKKEPPQIDRFRRLLIRSTRNGAINPQLYSGGTTPNSPTWVDGSGANRMRAMQSLTWTFSNATERTVCLYISNQAGATTFVGGGNLSAVSAAVPDDGLKLGTFNFGTTGDMAAGFAFPVADMLRIDAGTFTFYAINGSDPDNQLTVTDAVLARFTGLVRVNLPRSDTLSSVNWASRPSCTNIQLQQIGYTTAEVNAVLVNVDSAATSNGTLQLVQYRLAPAIAAAPPSGAGATAKAALIARGWTVTTD